ncbi:PEP-CTERM/exosortase system-associated acyltransferase [Candidatus Gracilibacteria bacterium]|nr:PEP-CTERM/exosortase system-associated acyltransferase [Candidatus Gracilibacteria bacterium]
MNPLKDSESHGVPNTVEGEKDTLLSHGLLASIEKRISDIFDKKNISKIHKGIKYIQNTVKGIVRYTVTLLTLKEKFESNYIACAGVDFMDAAARVRHKVFCQEKGWEEVQTDELEIDENDEHAIPIVLLDKNSSNPIACVRLILADLGDLPVEQYIEPIEVDRKRSAEVSRLAVIYGFRRRKVEVGKVFPEDIPDPIRGRFPIVKVGVFLSLISVARQNNIEHLYFLVEPSLLKNLKDLGAKPVQIGDPVDHKGIRVPCMISVSEMIDNLPWWSRPIWNSVCQQLHEK